MRTDDEILARIEEVAPDDFMGFERADLIGYLPFDVARPFLKDEATEADWQPAPRDRESILAVMRDYVEFAWGKANDEGGLSAERSMNHYSAWVWMLGDDLGDLNDYTDYGKPQLRRICEHYGFDCSAWDREAVAQ